MPELLTTEQSAKRKRNKKKSGRLRACLPVWLPFFRSLRKSRRLFCSRWFGLGTHVPSSTPILVSLWLPSRVRAPIPTEPRAAPASRACTSFLTIFLPTPRRPGWLFHPCCSERYRPTPAPADLCTTLGASGDDRPGRWRQKKKGPASRTGIRTRTSDRELGSIDFDSAGPARYSVSWLAGYVILAFCGDAIRRR